MNKNIGGNELLKNKMGTEEEVKIPGKKIRELQDEDIRSQRSSR